MPRGDKNLIGDYTVEILSVPQGELSRAEVRFHFELPPRFPSSFCRQSMEERHPGITNALVRERDAPFTDDKPERRGES